jgi:hypothetical protein
VRAVRTLWGSAAGGRRVVIMRVVIAAEDVIPCHLALGIATCLSGGARASTSCQHYERLVDRRRLRAIRSPKRRTFTARCAAGLSRVCASGPTGRKTRVCGRDRRADHVSDVLT